MIVLDASTAVDLLLQTEAAGRIGQRLRSEGGVIHAPHLLDVEVTHVLRRYALSGEVDAARCRQALGDLQLLPLTRHGHEVLLERVWALRNALTAYDATYVALAEALDCPLVTRDAKLARSHGHDARIEWV